MTSEASLLFFVFLYYFTFFFSFVSLFACCFCFVLFFVVVVVVIVVYEFANCTIQFSYSKRANLGHYLHFLKCL